MGQMIKFSITIDMYDVNIYEQFQRMHLEGVTIFDMGC